MGYLRGSLGQPAGGAVEGPPSSLGSFMPSQTQGPRMSRDGGERAAAPHAHRVRYTAALGAVAVSASLLAVASQATAATSTTFVPVGDTYVTAAHNHTNYGSSTEL